MRKLGRRCEGCVRPGPARFRTFADRYLCEECYGVFLHTGEIPQPSPEVPGEADGAPDPNRTYRV